MFDETAASTSLTRIEEEIRRFWRFREVPELARNMRRDGQPASIYQEPLAVAGQSWSDQVRLLSTSDLLARYRAMRGDAIRRQIGWLCHGLQVEIAVERSLAGDTMAEPTALHPAPADQTAVAQYNSACWNTVTDGLRRGEALTERLGVWSDPAETCISCTAQAIGAVWGALHWLWDAGKLSLQQSVVPFCPRCATPLSASEAARRAAQVQAHSLWVRLPWVGEVGAYLLASSSAPWTLVSMVALAVHPDADYALIEIAAEEDSPAELVLLAEPALESIPGDYRFVRSIRGRALRDAQYRPPFTFVPADQGAGCVILSEDVHVDRGTGLQILTPAFDAPSLRLATAHGFPVPKLLDDRQMLNSTVMRWRGLSPLDAEPLVIEDLRARGLLFRDTVKTQSQSLCPYCQTPLLPLARDVWQIETQDVPWIVGRDRVWGVPLPVWICEDCGEEICVAGLDDLSHRAGLDVQQMDPSRSGVDAVTFPCPSCHGTMRRVEPVVDVTLEAAVLSLSSWPSQGIASRSAGSFVPASRQGYGRRLAVGLGGKRSGWVDSLERTSALLNTPRIADGTVLLPDLDLEDTWGQGWNAVRGAPADALRWATYSRSTPEEAEREFLRPVWQLAEDLLAGDVLAGGEGENNARNELLGRWLKACLHQAVSATTAALDDDDPYQAACVLQRLVRDLTTWYALSPPGRERTAVTVLSPLLAPFVPYLAEAIHRRISKSKGESVHLGAWPSLQPAWADPDLVAQMSLLQRLAILGETARAQAGIEPDLPVGQAIVVLDEAGVGQEESLVPLKDLLAEILRAARVRIIAGPVAQVRWQLDLQESVVERSTPLSTIREALTRLDPERAAEMAQQLEAGLSVGLEVGPQTVTLLPDEVEISVQSEPGWIAAESSGQIVALKLA